MQQLEIFMDMQSRHSNIQSAVAFDPLLHVRTFDWFRFQRFQVQ